MILNAMVSKLGKAEKHFSRYCRLFEELYGEEAAQ